MRAIGLVIGALFFLSTLASASAQWLAGVAKVDITPNESVPLAGYSGTRMSQRVDHPIWIKALALRDETGATSVIVTSDLVGLSTTMVDRITAAASERFKLPRQRLILNYSHNHSCPITGDVLWLYYDLNEEESAARDRYTEKLYEQYNQVIEAAIADMKPAELGFEQGLAGFAVNRRRDRPGGRKLGGQVDHDVPVLVVKSEEKVLGIVFGYSCHTTALSGLSINGDYAGFSQLAIEEKYPGSVALFVQNCGGDANPLPRIRGSQNDHQAIRLAKMYGDILAEAVCQVVDGKLTPIDGPLHAAMGQTELFLQPGMPVEELRRRLPEAGGMVRREYEHFINQYQTLGELPDRVDYPIQVWRFGKSLTWIALTGETVVDYSLKFKGMYGWDNTWVCGYNNNLLSYVPSLRVLKEGGYEGTTGMFEYGHRAPYAENVEEQITILVAELVEQVSRD
jgi:neutral ceramidase